MSESIAARIREQQAASGVGPNEQEYQRKENEAATAPDIIATIGDRTFVVKPLNTADAVLLNRIAVEAIQKKMRPPLQAVLETLKTIPDCPPALRQELLSMAIKDQSSASGKASPTGEQIMEWIGTVEGVRQMFALLLRNEQPLVTTAWLAEHITEENYIAMLEKLGDSTGLSVIDPKSNPA